MQNELKRKIRINISRISEQCTIYITCCFSCYLKKVKFYICGNEGVFFFSVRDSKHFMLYENIYKFMHKFWKEENV